MNKLVKDTVNAIEKNFKANGLYITAKGNPVHCPQVNGLTIICLAELGFTRIARQDSESMLKSRLYDASKKAFYSGTDLKGRITDKNINACKNPIAALSLYATGFIEQANNVMDSLKNSTAFDSGTGLFKRQFNQQTNEINPLIITQSNLWAALTLAKLGRKKEANEILSAIKGAACDKNAWFYSSQDCRFKDSSKVIYCDDQALAAIAYASKGNNQTASKIMQDMLHSQLFDPKDGLFNSFFSDGITNKTKSAYKNALCGIALGKLGYEKELKRLSSSLSNILFDAKKKLFRQSTKDKILIPDNSALALTSINYPGLKHIVF